MTLYLCKKLNMMGLDISNLKDLYEDSKVQELKNELLKRSLTLIEFQKDKTLINEITDVLVERSLKRKEEIEFFAAIDFALTFYQDDSKIYFVIKHGVQPNEITINSLEDLKNTIEENTLIDFAILSNCKAKDRMMAC